MPAPCPKQCACVLWRADSLRTFSCPRVSAQFGAHCWCGLFNRHPPVSLLGAAIHLFTHWFIWTTPPCCSLHSCSSALTAQQAWLHRPHGAVSPASAPAPFCSLSYQYRDSEGPIDFPALASLDSLKLPAPLNLCSHYVRFIYGKR